MGAAALAAIGVAAHRRFDRYEIAGESMAPALDPGDYVIVDRQAYRSRLPGKGHVVLARDPRDPSREIVKRVASVDLHGELWLAGDNVEASTGSETFGSVGPRDVIGRVRWRYWPLRALFRVR
jgi:signal peptidase I